MATIRPSADLRNHYNEISDFCHNHREPVYITKNGKGDLVLLSNDEYERLCGRYELYQLLLEGLKDTQTDTGRPASEFFNDMERKYGFGKISSPR